MRLKMSDYIDAENGTSMDDSLLADNSTFNTSLEEFLYRALGPKHLPLTSLVPLTVIFSLLFITGVLGNISVCAVIIRNPSMHTATNYYLFNLAISDLNLLILDEANGVQKCCRKCSWCAGALPGFVTRLVPAPQRTLPKIIRCTFALLKNLLQSNIDFIYNHNILNIMNYLLGKTQSRRLSLDMSWLTSLIFLCLFTSVRTYCQPGDITFKNYRQFPKRSTLYYLEVRVEKCMNFDKLYYQWEVITEKGVVVPSINSDSAFLTLDGYLISDREIPVFYTILGAKVKVSHFSDLSHHIHDIVYFRFHPDQLHVSIKGGLRRTHLVGRDLILDGGYDSRDFSYRQDEDAFDGNLIRWSCKPQLQIEIPRSLVWRIPSKYFNPGDTYSFNLKINRTKIKGFPAYGEADQEVLFQTEIPVLNIECISNCFYSNIEHTTAFKVTCEENCNDMNYKWYAMPIVLEDKIAEFGDGTDKLLIKPNVLLPGESYLFGCKLDKADVSMALFYINNIARGNCTMEPMLGIAGYTNFEITCDSFITPFGDLMFIAYQGDPKSNKSVMLSYGSNSQIKDILLSEGESKVTVVVRDFHLMQDSVTIENVKILPFEESLPQKQDLERVVKVMILGQTEKSLRTLLEENDHDGLIQRSSVLLSSLNTMDVTTAAKRDLMFHIIKYLNEIKMGNHMVAQQVMSILWKILEAKEETDTHVTHMQSKIITKVAKALYRYATDPRQRFVTITYVLDEAQKLLDLFSELLTRVEKLIPLLRAELPPHEYDSYDEMDSAKIIVRINFAGLVYELFETLEYISKALFPMLIVDQQPVELDSKALTFSVRRLRPALFDGINFTCKEQNVNHIVIPNETIADLASQYEYVDYEYVHFKVNPFWWHSKQDLLNTEYVGFDLFNNGAKIKQVSGYIDVFVNVIRAGGPSENVINGTLKKDELAVYRVETVFEIPKSVLRIAFSESSKIKILLQKCPPSAGEVKSKGIITNEILYQPDENELEMYLGVLNVDQSEVSYSGTVDNYICVTWDQKGKSLVWGGFLFSELVNGSLHCRSSHLSVFGGGIGVAPNKIEIPVDLGILLFIHNNFLMLVVLLSVFLLWLLLMVWAFLRDRRLSRKNVVFLLEDSLPSDKYAYLIVVVTGLQYDAGTTANVCFQLVGTEAESRPHLIKCDIYDPLQRGSEDWFVIYCPKYLGEVIQLRLWHNCRGRRPHWYCQRVIVHELKSGEEFCFIVEKWFSLVWGDSEVSRTIPVTTKDNLKSPKIVFPITVSRRFRDGHLWFSIFSSSPQSNFTTKERVTVAICLLLLTMLASGMFYGLPKGDASDAIFSQGSYYITTREVLIFLESLAVTIPAAIILVLLFKKSGPPPLAVGKKRQ